MDKILRLSFVCFLFALTAHAQEEENGSKVQDSLQTDLKREGIAVQDSIIIKKKEINVLAPSKAAFYSAVLPGLGQIYNKRYWKVPIVYAAIGTGIYAYTFNNNLYNRYRTAYKSRLAGFTTDEFYDLNNSGIDPGNPDLSDQALQDAQERYQKDRDLSLLITIGLYALNIVDANVDAHLKQFNVSDDLSMDMRIMPYLTQDPITTNVNYGLGLKVKF
ncbi:DUF5683 domain-containing protein [Flavobacteriaceae bacterium F89]|uniref:DUF5683 domain-containing protein n=1 Tax=Cerina litoralis TaxID=2874477 RepID=A0AAE3JR07_9FLAO|nr:DUF5683 domain-containing protein [Cerina litoralis]MCG2462449.1 DUF5683 domain-containing protein [Cerina litoralis]